MGKEDFFGFNEWTWVFVANLLNFGLIDRQFEGDSVDDAFPAPKSPHSLNPTSQLQISLIFINQISFIRI